MDDIITALLPLLGDANLATMAPLAILVTVVLRIWTIKWVRDKVFGWVAKLPKNMQPVAPCVLAMAIQACEAYLSGKRGEELAISILTVGLGSGVLAGGLYHFAVKRGWPLVLQLVAKLRRAPPAVTAFVLAVVASPCLLGCSVSLEGARAQGAADRRAGATLAAPSGRCESLDSRHRWGGAVAAGAALLAGGSGLSGVAVDREDNEWRYGLAAGAVGAAALAAGAELYARDAASSWARECQQ
jgi:hypothetical protein